MLGRVVTVEVELYIFLSQFNWRKGGEGLRRIYFFSRDTLYAVRRSLASQTKQNIPLRGLVGVATDAEMHLSICLG
jgi:hypothetical protein